MALPTMTALAALCVAFAPPNADPLADLNFRPPAIPLITTDPFMQVWIRGNTSTAPNVTHWTGQPKTTTGLLRVDGTTYRYLGNGTEPPLAQPTGCASATATSTDGSRPRTGTALSL